MQNKKENFSEWYNEILETAEMSDKRYPVKGMNVWLPYGLKAMNMIDLLARELSEDHGIEEVRFPVLITRNQLAVEFEHLKGFEGELYWVTKGGYDQLDIDMALRPTSESAMYPMFSLWIRNHADLPKRIFQIVSVYRYETKHTRSFLRVREIHFYEAHTAHESYEDAERQIGDYMKIWEGLNRTLKLPHVINRRPDWDKFPGAVYTIAADAIMPGGRTLQVATMHHYGENFSKTYDIRYSDESGESHYVHQTTYGMSERLLGAVIGIHGDDMGLILPSGIAPVQVVIVPIPSQSADTASYGAEIMRTLRMEGIRCTVDTRDGYTPGWKYNYWEMKGVPVRIEVGEKEVSSQSVTLAVRTIKGRRKTSLKDLTKSVREALAEHDEKLEYNSGRVIGESVRHAEKVEDMKGQFSYFAYWCGDRECSDRIESETEKNCLGVTLSHPSKGKCVVCGRDGDRAMFSRTY